MQPVGRVAGNTGLWRGLVTGSAPFSVQIEDTNNQVSCGPVTVHMLTWTPGIIPAHALQRMKHRCLACRCTTCLMSSRGQGWGTTSPRSSSGVRCPATRGAAELSAALEWLAASTGALQRTHVVHHMLLAGYDTDSDVAGEAPLPRQARLCHARCSAVTQPSLRLCAGFTVRQPARWSCQLERADCPMCRVEHDLCKVPPVRRTICWRR